MRNSLRDNTIAMRLSIALLLLFLGVATGCSQRVISPALPVAPQQSETFSFRPSAMAGGFKSLYRFRGAPDGANPAGLVALNGTLVGTTMNGGAQDLGTV